MINEAEVGPLFSIVTVVFNDLLGLTVTRESLEAQTFRDYEWIIIDGASTDGTAEYLYGFQRAPDDPAAERPRLMIVSEADSGIYNAMNKGLALATGTFAIFMNAGDAFAGAAVLEQVAARGPCGEHDLIYGDALERLRDDKPSYAADRDPVLLLKRARNIRAIRYGMFTHHQAIFFRRRFLVEHGICYDESLSIAADYALAAEAYVRGCRPLKLTFPICIFARGGTSQRNQRLGRRDVSEVQRRILGLGTWHLLWNRAGLALSAILRRYFSRAYDRIRFRRVSADRG